MFAHSYTGEHCSPLHTSYPNIRKNHMGDKMDQDSNFVNLTIPDSLIRSIKHSERRNALHAPAKRRRLKPQYRRRFIFRLAVIVLFPLISVGLTVWAVTNKNAIEVYAADELIGLVRMDKQMTSEILVQQAKTKLEEDNQTQVIITPNISLKPVRAANNSLTENDVLLNKLCGSLQFQVQASAFILDGKPLAILKDKAEALTVQDNIFLKYISRNSDIESCSFVENVSIEDIFVEKSAIITMGKAFDVLTAESVYPYVYTVESDDVLGLIAQKNKMTLPDLIAANPGILANTTLRVGQELNVKKLAPLLSVKTIETVVSDEIEQAPIQHQINPRAKTTRTIQTGRDGKKRVTKRVTRINGVFMEEEIVNIVIFEEPIPQIDEIPQ